MGDIASQFGLNQTFTVLFLLIFVVFVTAGFLLRDFERIIFRRKELGANLVSNQGASGESLSREEATFEQHITLEMNKVREVFDEQRAALIKELDAVSGATVEKIRKETLLAMKEVDAGLEKQQIEIQHAIADQPVEFVQKLLG